jgi:hypothetical protein
LEPGTRRPPRKVRGARQSGLSVTNVRRPDAIAILPNGDSAELIKKKLGAPLSEKIENVKNIHDYEQTDKIDTLKYQGLEVQVLIDRDSSDP